MNENMLGCKKANESVERWCLEFESDWHAKRDSVESFIERRDIPDGTADELLARLVKCEIELKRQLGSDVHLEEYRRRFPAMDSEILANLFSMPAPPRPLGPAEASPILPARYKVIEQIGKGGIGSVWRVIDREMERPLAAKVLLDQYKRNAAANFRLEREAMLAGSLQHPGIPPVYELGDLVTGSKFFTMKLVDGETLDQILCNRSNTAEELQQALNVFRQIAEAVGFAHSQQVIHRDLKPQNVMVGEFGEVQIMDWGMAKKLNNEPAPRHLDVPVQRNHSQNFSKPERETSSLSLDSSMADVRDDFLLTMQGDVVGTPMYMSPEQARGELESLTESSDVFSLGSILFEILTSQRLFQTAEANVLQAASQGDVSEAMQRLQATETDPELVAICGACLEPMPENRLRDGRHVATAIAKHLDSVAERLQTVEMEKVAAEVRFNEARKQNRQAMWLTGAIITAILAGLVGVIWQWNRATNSAKAALRSAQESATSANRSAEVLQIVTDAFDTVDPNSGSDSSMTAKDVLINARSSLEESDLDAQGRMLLLDNLGSCFRAVGEYELATKSLEEAVELYTEILGERAAETLVIMNELAGAYLDLGKLDDALKLQMRTLELQKQQLGNEHADTLASMNNLALIHEKAGRYQEAVRLYESLFELHEAKGDARPESMRWMSNLSAAYYHLGQIDEAVMIDERLLESQIEEFGEDHPDTMLAMNNLSMSYKSLGRFEEALELAQRTFELVELKYGEKHPNTLIVMGNVGLMYEYLGRFDEAILQNEKTLKLKTEKFGKEHPETLTTMNNLANTYLAVGRLEEALEMHKQAFKLQAEKLGKSHKGTLMSMQNLAHVYSKMGKYEQALDLEERTLALRTDQLGKNHPDTLMSMNNLAEVYKRLGRYDEALQLFEKTLVLKKNKFGDEHPETGATMNNLAEAYAEIGKFNESLSLHQETLELFKKLNGEKHPRTLVSMSNVGLAMQRLGDHEQALSLFKRTWSLQKEKLGENHISTVNTMGNLANCYRLLNKLGESTALLERTVDIYEATVGSDHPDTVDAMKNLAHNYVQTKEFEKARQLLETCLSIQKSNRPDHWLTFDTACQYGGVMLELGEVEKSAELIEAGYQGLKSSVVPATSRKDCLADALKQMIRLRKVQDLPEDAAQLELELRELVREPTEPR